MYEYVDNMLTELPMDMNRMARTPAANHLFNVNLDAKKLPEASAQRFHHLVAKWCTYLDAQGRTFKWWLLFFAHVYNHLMNTTTKNLRR